MASQPRDSFVCHGYSCQFVEEIPKEFQTECSICLHTVRDPQMVDCCGYRFCKLCIEPLKSMGKRCPLCNCTFTSVMPDKFLQRTLNEKHVYCAHRNEGCDWIGELSQFERHLNARPESAGRRFEGCPNQKLECVYCKVEFKRCMVAEHETSCPKMITCRFCGNYRATLSEMATHWTVCPDYPVVCPNDGCEAKVKQLNVKMHVKERCPYRVVPCKYDYAGCKVMLPHKLMQIHFDNDAKDHVALLDDLCLKQRYEKENLKDVQAAQESQIADLQEELSLSEGDCDLLKELASLRIRGDISDSDSEILVSNLPYDTTEHMVKSRFGQYGKVYRVELYEWNNMAVVEYESSDSVDYLFDIEAAKDLRLRGRTLHFLRI